MRRETLLFPVSVLLATSKNALEDAQLRGGVERLLSRPKAKS